MCVCVCVWGGGGGGGGGGVVDADHITKAEVCGIECDNLLYPLTQCSINHNEHIDVTCCCCCYAPAYSKNSGWALSITPVRPVRLSVRPSVHPTSCPGHNSQTVWNVFMKLHRCIHHIETMCHEQGRQLLHFWFLNYFRLT